MSVLGGAKKDLSDERGSPYEHYTSAMGAFINKPSVRLMGDLIRATVTFNRHLLQQDLQKKSAQNGATLAAQSYYSFNNMMRSTNEAFSIYYGKEYDPFYESADVPNGFNASLIHARCKKGLENICLHVKAYLEQTLEDVPFSSKEEQCDLAMKDVKEFVNTQLIAIAANVHIHSVDTRAGR